MSSRMHVELLWLRMGDSILLTQTTPVSKVSRTCMVHTGLLTEVLDLARGSSGHKPGDHPGIALDATGRIYVADTSNNRIVRFDNFVPPGVDCLRRPGSGNGTNQFNFPIWNCGRWKRTYLRRRHEQ